MRKRLQRTSSSYLLQTSHFPQMQMLEHIILLTTFQETNFVILYTYLYACMCAKSFWSYPTLCDSMDHSWPGSAVRGILQASVLVWVAMPFFKGSSPPRDPTHVSYVSTLAGRFFTTSATWEVPYAIYMCMLLLSLFSRVRLCATP